MATVTRENIGTLTDKLTVSLQKEDYLPNFDKAIKSASKSANLPGFRKGMVPAGLVKKMHGQSVFTDEVLKLVEKELTDYMEKEQLEIFAQPLPTDENDVRNLDVNNPGNYEFRFEIGMKPSFEIAPLETANITKYKVIVTDEMVNNEIERMVTQASKPVEQETIAAEDHLLHVTFAQHFETEEEAPNDIIKDMELKVTDFTPSFREQLMGRKKDETILLQPNNALEEDTRKKLLSEFGLDADDAEAGNLSFNMTINVIEILEKKEVDETFFNQVYPNRAIATLDEFKAELKKEIEAYWENQGRNLIHDGVFHYLVDNTQISFPDTFLKKWMQNGREKPATAEEVEAEYPKFSNSLKWTLISDKLIKDNNIQVTPDEVKQFSLRQVMGYMGITALDESHGWLEDYANRMMKDKKYVEDSYNRIVTEKLFHMAGEKVQTTEKEISMEDFTRMQQEHQHHH